MKVKPTTVAQVLLLLETDSSQANIARVVGVSRQRVHQIIGNRHLLIDAARIEVVARLAQVEDTIGALRQILSGYEELAALEPSND